MPSTERQHKAGPVRWSDGLCRWLVAPGWRRLQFAACSPECLRGLRHRHGGRLLKVGPTPASRCAWCGRSVKAEPRELPRLRALRFAQAKASANLELASPR